MNHEYKTMNQEIMSDVESFNRINSYKKEIIVPRKKNKRRLSAT